jgi:hypothetical protein
MERLSSPSGRSHGMDAKTATILAKQLTRDVEWPGIDDLVIDLPPRSYVGIS